MWRTRKILQLSKCKTQSLFFLLLCWYFICLWRYWRFWHFQAAMKAYVAFWRGHECCDCRCSDNLETQMILFIAYLHWICAENLSQVAFPLIFFYKSLIEGNEWDVDLSRVCCALLFFLSVCCTSVLSWPLLILCRSHRYTLRNLCRV